MNLDKKVIIFFGGSFNPPLVSHFSLAQQIVSEYDQIEKVVFVPVNGLYEKSDLLNNEHRYNMLKVVTDKNEKFDVSRIEIDSERPLYTIESLRIMQREYPEYEIWFAIGTDNLKTLHTWKNAEELVSEFKILILEREPDDMKEIIQDNPFLKEHRDAFIKIKGNVRSNLCSTFARDKMKQGKSIRYLTPDEVYEYINKFIV
ncbi:MAG: nicotinate (nicotinamide) nucleotide adenylyltransferase [Oscillospiraceae bacterium]|nr:nicotinate (nicotinamide) nucleotide adenylyltransferase [Oscillospiraceae bacterium]